MNQCYFKLFLYHVFNENFCMSAVATNVSRVGAD